MSQILVTGEAKIRDIQGPVVSNSGVITALDGDASQYVRGDGTLADFPTSTGGGSSVSYYLNSSVSQGTIGGVAYRQLSKTPISGAGTDIAISANGYVASYITDANDPALLEVPAGNFNCEFYFSVNNNTGDPFVYAEVYKYDGTTFTLLGTSTGVPEFITEGTVINPYYFAVPVAVSALSVTDRIAIRIYVNVDGRTVTLHTENNHLCQVVTTFSKGLISLNNLTRQNQFFATGTSGTDFAISSATATHTFNLPVASATNTGKLSSTDWSTFNGKVPYTGATQSVNLGGFSLTASALTVATNFILNSTFLLKKAGLGTTTPTYVSQFAALTGVGIGYSDGTGGGNFVLQTAAIYDYTFPAITGTLALLEGTQTFSGSKTFSNTTLVNTIYIDGVSYLKHLTSTSYITGYTTYSAKANGVIEYFFPSSFKSVLDFNDAADYTYTFPASSGTIALTSDLGSYVTLATTQTISAIKKYTDYQQFDNGIKFKSDAVGSSIVSGYVSMWFGIGDGKNVLGLASSATSPVYYTYAFPNAAGTIALTSDLSAYLPLSGGTLTGALSGTSATFSGGVTTPSITNGGQFKMDYGANAVSRSWRLISDSYNFGDFSIQQSTTQSGSTYADRLLISASGNVGIGTSSPAATLQVVGDVYVGSYHSANKLCLGADTNDFLQYSSSLDGILMASYGATAFYTGASSAERMRISSAGVVTIANLAGTGSRAVLADASGNLSAPVSDISVKKNITSIGYGLSEILKMNPVWYNFIDDYKNYGEGRQNGNIAQEMQKIIPEAVFVTPSTGKMGINYDQMHAVYIKAIQELKLEIEELKALINK